MLVRAGATCGAGAICAASWLLRAPRLLAATAALISALVIACAVSWAHSHVDERNKVTWYPIECCHDGDCRPAEQLKHAAGGEWFRTIDGVTILADQRVERRTSVDGRWHICIGVDDTETPFVRCIFEPSSS